MGPLLLNGIIDQGWSLVLMFIIGLAFGFILEQAGFSSSRKLVGIFFGYDFVVLKVFFTAGITAMIGLIFMEHFGLIDMQLVNINSNHLWSAVIGGVIMGFGFMLGGFCPGTSVTAAVIGKIDAMIFIAGIFLGIFVFGSFYDGFAKLFSGYYFDGEFIYNTLGMGRGWFVMMMIVMAVAAFAVGEYFEKNASIGLKPTNIRYKGYVLEVVILIILGIIIIRIPERSPVSFTERQERNLLNAINEQERFMSADELSYRLINDKRSIEIIDVRDEEAFKRLSLPGSMNIPLKSIADMNYREYIDQEVKKIVFVSEGGIKASKAWMYATRKGYDHVYVLEGGLNHLISEIFYNAEVDSNEFRFRELHTARFRKKASEFLREGKIEVQKSNAMIEPKPEIKQGKVSSGGC